jgi:hypothetical protein
MARTPGAKRGTTTGRGTAGAKGRASAGAASAEPAGKAGRAAATPARRRARSAKEAASPAKAAVAPPADRDLRVRMYRHGLGDCFLLSLPRAGGGRFHMMIDCGVLLGTRDIDTQLQSVVQDIIDATGEEAQRRGAKAAGLVDVLVVTHEHYDHVSGFLRAQDLFATPNDPAPGTKLGVGEVWMPWTENPRDTLATAIRENREVRLRGLAAAVQKLDGLGLGASALGQGLRSQLGFFGVDDPQALLMPAGPTSAGGGRRPSATTRALDIARGLAPRPPRYWKPGDPPWTSEEVPGLRIFPLGPPRDETMLLKTYAKREVYHLAGMRGGFAAALVAAAEAAPPAVGEWVADAYCPFDQTYARPFQPPPAGMGGPPPSATRTDAFLHRYYYGPTSDPADPDQSWRRIDGDWLGAAAEMALALDSATNNTSLVLALELEATGQVLLFAADAQVGSWLSWHDLRWTLPERREVTGTDLIRRTSFYKVGHHGSHNATLRDRGLEMMDSPGLVAFLPVHEETAIRMGWNRMPLPSLVEALIRRCEGRLVRADRSYAETRGQTRAEQEFQRHLTETELYYEWSTPIA